MSGYDSWLEDPYNAAEEANLEFEELVEEYMKGDYNPYLEDNIRDVFINDGFFNEHWATLVQALQDGNKEVVGLIVSTCIYEYWEKMAEDRVIEC